MKLSDIAKVRVDWMEKFGNNPRLQIILKRGCELETDFRFKQFGNLFHAEKNGQVHYYWHNPNEHNGFAGREITMQMHDEWNPAQFRGCKHTERIWMSGGQTRDVECKAEGRTVKLIGPWIGNLEEVASLYGGLVDASVMPASWRDSVKLDSRTYNKRRAWSIRRGAKAHIEDPGLYIGCTLTFVKTIEIIENMAPHIDLYHGDYGWYPMMRGGEPKNPRRTQ